VYQYVHGGDIYSANILHPGEEVLDFSANINPLGLPEEVKTAVRAAVDDCTKYPDPFYRRLKAALAEYEKIDQEWLFCAGGASEIIFRLALAVKPHKALLLAPTFADYERAMQTVGCISQYYYLAEENDFQVGEDILSQIDEDLDMVFICNPNNPTGQLCTNSFLQKVLERCRTTKTVLVVDECFMDFVDQPEHHSMQAYIADYPNLLILKAFTKIFAMPGLRLGYALTSNILLLDKLRLAGQDWSVSTLAQAAGISALQQADYLRRTKLMVGTERQFLLRELTALGFEVFGSQANYIFFKAEGIADLYGRLLQRGILIRSCANYVNLNAEFYRVAVKTRKENIKLIKGIKEVL